MKTYKLEDIKTVCEIIYGHQIADSTWRRWKNKLQCTPYEKTVNEDKMEQLITLANLKRKSPYAKVSLFNTMKHKMEALENLTQIEDSYKLHLVPEECKGSDIIPIIEMITGRKVSLKSLYRWGEKLEIPFSTNRNYTKDTVSKFISQIL